MLPLRLSLLILTLPLVVIIVLSIMRKLWVLFTLSLPEVLLEKVFTCRHCVTCRSCHHSCAHSFSILWLPPKPHQRLLPGAVLALSTVCLSSMSMACMCHTYCLKYACREQLLSKCVCYYSPSPTLTNLLLSIPACAGQSPWWASLIGITDRPPRWADCVLDILPCTSGWTHCMLGGRHVF